jgi:RPA family protein
MAEDNQNQKRQVAYKVRIKELLEGRYVKEEGWTPNYIETREGKRISRINLVGVVVSKNEEANYSSIALEDGTGRISVRSFDEKAKFEEVNIGDILLLIGRPKEYGSEKYILLEILKKLKDENWIKVRRLELDKNIEEAEDAHEAENLETEEETIEQEEVAENKYHKIIQKIKELDKGEGADFDEIVKGVEEGGKLIDDLLKKGDVFETKPGKLKILE